MLVWLVEEPLDNDKDQFHGIFSTEEKAKNYVESQPAYIKRYLEVYEIEVDEECK